MSEEVYIVIPTLNEEKSIGEVIEGFQKLGFKNILVIDGNSTDRTREIAKKKGAKVIIQSGKGKGQAIQEAFEIIDSDIVIIIDGDGTYLPEEVYKLLEPIKKGIADHVIGNRFANFEKGAFTKLNLIGNKILNFIFRMLYGENIYDLLSGYRALKKSVYKSIYLKKQGFEVETELTVQTLSKGFRIYEVPITYKKRIGKTKLNPIKDGFKISKAIISLMFEYSPGKIFLIFGIILVLFGVFFGLKTVIDWFNGVTHYLLAPLTALLIISGLLLIILGIITNSLLRSINEVRRDVIEIKDLIAEMYKKNK